MVCWGWGSWWKWCSSCISHPVVAGYQLFIIGPLSSTLPIHPPSGQEVLYSQFVDKETEGQRGARTCPGPSHG